MLTVLCTRKSLWLAGRMPKVFKKRLKMCYILITFVQIQNEDQKNGDANGDI